MARVPTTKQVRELDEQSFFVDKALKILEANFGEILYNYLGMRLYKETLYKLTKAIKYATKSLKQHCDILLATTFGIFSATLVHLLDAKPSNDIQKEELTKRSKLGKAIFLEVV